MLLCIRKRNPSSRPWGCSRAIFTKRGASSCNPITLPESGTKQPGTKRRSTGGSAQVGTSRGAAGMGVPAVPGSPPDLAASPRTPRDPKPSRQIACSRLPKESSCLELTLPAFGKMTRCPASNHASRCHGQRFLGHWSSCGAHLGIWWNHKALLHAWGAQCVDPSVQPRTARLCRVACGTSALAHASGASGREGPGLGERVPGASGARPWSEVFG